MKLKDNWLQGLLVLLLSLIAQNVMQSIYYNRDQIGNAATTEYVNKQDAAIKTEVDKKANKDEVDRSLTDIKQTAESTNKMVQFLYQNEIQKKNK